MGVRRVVAAAVVPFALVAVSGGPASAHGAPGTPVSRAAACGPEGGAAARSAACRAAAAAGADFAQWDNVRVAGVAGRDRELIPDGKLCSAGLAKFRGMDLARADWPATRLVAGSELSFAYRTTIPHMGSFRLYVTNQGYDPTRPLSWSDLAAKPFLTSTDPPVRAGAYRFKGKLPANRSGRQMIYTVWQNSESPDTYYSCSDVVFAAAARPAATGSVGTGSGGTNPPAPPAGSPAAPSTAGPTSPESAELGPAAAVAAQSAATGGAGWLLAAIGGGLALVGGGVGVLWLRRRRMT
jgi:predicted carbohydrate-binding protein with CBM5 and CBM33 domain